MPADLRNDATFQALSQHNGGPLSHHTTESPYDHALPRPARSQPTPSPTTFGVLPRHDARIGHRCPCRARYRLVRNIQSHGLHGQCPRLRALGTGQHNGSEPDKCDPELRSKRPQPDNFVSADASSISFIAEYVQSRPNGSQFWLAITGQPGRAKDLPEVIIHDPAAQRPHDLDDPFHDFKVQSRIADVIAKNAGKKS